MVLGRKSSSIYRHFWTRREKKKNPKITQEKGGKNPARRKSLVKKRKGRAIFRTTNIVRGEKTVLGKEFVIRKRHHQFNKKGKSQGGEKTRKVALHIIQ